MASASYSAKTLNTWHAHCDVIPEVFTFGVSRVVSDRDSSRSFGVLAQDLVLVVHSDELMTEIQKQLREATNDGLAYKKDSITIQLADNAGVPGSSMIESNVSTRFLHYLEELKSYMAKEYVELASDDEKRGLPTFASGAEVSIPGVKMTPTQVGVRLYAKLPAESQKIRDLAIAYGAIPEGEGGPRNVENKDCALKVNMCGFYMGKFYCNFRIIAPFNHRDKPEVLAKSKKSKTSKPRARKVSEGEGAGAGPKKRKAVTAPVKKALKRTSSLYESVTADGQQDSEDDSEDTVVVEDEEEASGAAVEH